MSRSPNGWDKGTVGTVLNFRHLQDSEVGRPLMESIPGIVVGADILQPCWTANRSIEHTAQDRAIKDAALTS